jgi:hypothetical protein
VNALEDAALVTLRMHVARPFKFLLAAADPPTDYMQQVSLDFLIARC